VQLIEESRLDEKAGIKDIQSTRNISKVNAHFIVKFIIYRNAAYW